MRISFTSPSLSVLQQSFQCNAGNFHVFPNLFSFETKQWRQQLKLAYNSILIQKLQSDQQKRFLVKKSFWGPTWKKKIALKPPRASFSTFFGQPVSFTKHPVSCINHTVSCTKHPVSCINHPVSCKEPIAAWPREEGDHYSWVAPILSHNWPYYTLLYLTIPVLHNEGLRKSKFVFLSGSEAIETAFPFYCFNDLSPLLV